MLILNFGSPDLIFDDRPCYPRDFLNGEALAKPIFMAWPQG